MPEGTAGYVYFIQGETGGPVKIGWAKCPEKRLSELQIGNPAKLRIAATVPGSRSLEGEIHARLREFRGVGEWFYPEEPAFKREMRRLPGIDNRGIRFDADREASVCLACSKAVHYSDSSRGTPYATALYLLESCLLRIAEAERREADEIRDDIWEMMRAGVETKRRLCNVRAEVSQAGLAFFAALDSIDQTWLGRTWVNTFVPPEQRI